MTKLNKRFRDKLRKGGPNKGAWTYVTMRGSAKFFGTRGQAEVRKAIAKEAGDTVTVELQKRLER